MVPSVLLLSAGFGSGHLQAARAVGQACSLLVPGCSAEAVNVDSMVLRWLARGYLTLIDNAPAVYRSLYHAPVGGGTRRMIRWVLRSAVLSEVRRVGPTAVVTTHPFPAGVTAHLRRTGQIQAPVHVVLTDFMPHPLWVHEGVDRYFVASGDAARRLQILGVSPGRITVTGIPIRTEFADAGGARRVTDLRRRVLVMGGGLGLGPIVEAVRSLATLPQANLAVSVVCGSNRELQADLHDLFDNDPRVEVVGCTDQVPAMMTRADLLVSKPGGITCSEALACGLPMLLLRPLPGHEEENAAFLAGTGAARVVDEVMVGQAAAEILFSGGERLAHMRESARIFGRPDSAVAIANMIFTSPKQNRHTGTTG